MKLSLATAPVPFVAAVIAVPEENVANRVQIHSMEVNGEVFHGEPPSFLEARDIAACTNCVGHNGSCTVGEGNCYAPDGCYFCGGCLSSEARCQNPDKEGCQCYS